MAELLFELGCEELPATSVRRAYTQLADRITALLSESAITFGEVVAMGTPRRLIVSIKDVSERQPDQSKAMRGPAIRAAYDESGQATKALEGFCRGQGATLEDLTNDGEYVWYEKQIPGRPAAEVLAEILPASVKDLTFDKTMRWGSSRMRFARPIRWILATFGGSVVPFEIEGVASGNESRGHRFYHPETFVAASSDALLAGLRERKVEPNPNVREERIRTEAAKVASGTPELPDALVDENVFLTEWPTVIEGEFPTDYLSLPEPVLVTAMAKHERFFPVRDKGGKITNRFLSVRNAGQDDTVRAGNQWVLNARFNDAEFFFRDDSTKTMDDFLAQTERMTFQEGLGSVRQRADRLAALMEFIDSSGAAKQAGLYAKADLSSGLVSEFASLQGIIGGEYARREGMPEEVSKALGGQYTTPSAESHPLAVKLLVADQVDKLVGFTGLGHTPSGSSDPYGLRRAAGLIIQAYWTSTETKKSVAETLDKASELYGQQSISLNSDSMAAIKEIFSGRYPALRPDVRHDIMDAAITDSSSLNPNLVRFRIDILDKLGDSVVQALCRPLNILAAAEKKGIQITEFSALKPKWEHESESVLESAAREELPTEDSESCVAHLIALAPKIDNFFESVMVMDEREDVRNARLALLGEVRRRIEPIGDVTKIVIEG